MLKNFEYRLYPTKKQAKALDKTLQECRWLYNHFLEQRKTAYEERQESIGLFDQHAELPALKKERPALKEIHSQVLQNVPVRLDLAFKAFFRRVKNGETPGYPRFRGRDRYDSFTFPQVPSGCSLKGDAVFISKIGKVKVVLHRELEGRPKTCTIKRTATGKWFAVFSCEVESKRLPKMVGDIAIDVGLESFAHLSNNERIENPRFFRADEKELGKTQRTLSKFEKGQPERARAKRVVSRIHERIGFRRKNFAHQEARKIVNRFGTICIEDIQVNRMLHNHCLATSISDASWSMFFGLVQSKAEEAGRIVVKVNPAYTSQDCSRCGHREKKSLSCRVHKCECCGLEIHRDLNAALNILALGLQSLRRETLEAPPIARQRLGGE